MSEDSTTPVSSHILCFFSPLCCPFLLNKSSPPNQIFFHCVACFPVHCTHCPTWGLGSQFSLWECGQAIGVHCGWWECAFRSSLVKISLNPSVRASSWFQVQRLRFELLSNMGGWKLSTHFLTLHDLVDDMSFIHCCQAGDTLYLLSVLFMASCPPLWSPSICNVTDSRMAVSVYNMGVSACSISKALRKGRLAISGNPLFANKENPHFFQWLIRDIRSYLSVFPELERQLLRSLAPLCLMVW